jgi:hypothetical protein
MNDEETWYLILMIEKTEALGKEISKFWPLMRTLISL